MKYWKQWTIVTIIVIVLGSGAGFLVLWNNLSYEWAVQKNAAAYAVDHGPITTITNHDVFTAVGAQEVFYGKDKLGRSWITFVYGSPFTEQSVQDKGYLTKVKITRLAKSSGLTVVSAHIGYLDGNTQTNFGVLSDVVWELYAQTKAGDTKYFYYDARTGKLLKSY